MPEWMPLDHLTGFFSRESLKEFLQETILEAASGKKSLLVTLVDLDRFKNFNDKFGHVFGDEILKYAAEALRSTIGETSNYFFRYGGDEFVVVTIDKNPAEIIWALKKFNAGTSYRPSLGQKKSYKITMSAGITIFPKDAQTVEELIRKADKAMYFSKRHGRKMVALAGRMNFIVMTDIFMLSVGAVVGLYLIMYLFFNPFLASNTVSYCVNQARRIKIVIKTPSLPKPASPEPILTKQSNLDIVRLKGGNIYEGRILINSSDGVIISVKKEKGEFMLNLPASKIDSIKYGIRTPVAKTAEGHGAEVK